MHEVGVVGESHLFRIYSPVTVRAQHLAIIVSRVCSPVLGIYEVCSLECLSLVIFHFRTSYKCRVELISFRMSDHELIIRHVDAFCKGVRNCLRKRLRMRSPCHYDLRLLDLFIFFNGDKVGKCLQRMPRRCLHTEYRLAGIFDELIHNHLIIVVFLILETCKGTHSDHIAVASHYRNRFKQMLRLVTVHDDSALCLQFPCSLIHIQYDYIHTEVQCRLLSTQTGTQTGIEEYHQEGLVAAELLICKRILFYVFCRGKGIFKVTELGD